MASLPDKRRLPKTNQVPRKKLKSQADEPNESITVEVPPKPGRLVKKKKKTLSIETDSLSLMSFRTVRGVLQPRRLLIEDFWWLCTPCRKEKAVLPSLRYQSDQRCGHDERQEEMDLLQMSEQLGGNQVLH